MSTSTTTPGDVAVPPRTGADFPLLDTLRAVGAMCVVTTHAAYWSGDYTRDGAWGTFLARLDVGVAIFFVLSGFLLFRPWLLRAAEGAAAPRPAAYGWKRLVRIAPTYVVTVVLVIIFVAPGARRGAGDWVSTLMMLDLYHTASFPRGLTQMWSLSVEVAFYALLPMLAAIIVGRSRRLSPVRVIVGLCVLVAISLWWHLALASTVDAHSDGTPLLWLPGYLTWFALGMLLALAQVLHTRQTWSRWVDPLVSLARQPGSCWALVLGLMLVSATPLAGPTMLAASTAAETTTKHLVYAAVGFLVVLTGVFPDLDSRYAHVMGHKAGRRLGWISYGVFCLHLPILHFVMWSTGWVLFEGRGLLIWLLAVALSLVAADICYRLVERPAQRLRGVVRDGEATVEATSTATSGTSIA